MREFMVFCGLSSVVSTATLGGKVRVVYSSYLRVKSPHISVQRGISPPVLLRGPLVIRTYGAHKNLDIPLLIQTIFDPIYYAPP